MSAKEFITRFPRRRRLPPAPRGLPDAPADRRVHRLRGRLPPLARPQPLRGHAPRRIPPPPHRRRVESSVMPTPWDAYRSALPSIAAAVGHTPLVRLNRVTAGVAPADLRQGRVVRRDRQPQGPHLPPHVRAAEQRGDLRPGMRVLECSTGNAGIACAWVAAVKGYPCTIVMPEGMSEERKKIMRAYGARLVFTPGGESDVDLALASSRDPPGRPRPLLGARPVRQPGQRGAPTWRPPAPRCGSRRAA